MLGLEWFSLKGFDLEDFHFKGFEDFGDFGFIKLACFGEVDGDAVVDVSSGDAIDFFQGHTGLFVVDGSSSAGG